MARPIVSFMTLYTLCGAMTLHAQQVPMPAAPPDAPAPAATPYAGGQLGAIFGTVADSLHDGPLADATVTVIQLPRKSAITTTTGAFRIDSLPPGQYTLELLHPLLDSLGIRVVSDTIVVTGGIVHTKFMSTPSAQTLAVTLCSPVKRQLGPAVIVGQVFDADTDTPAVGAEVSAAWVETQASLERGIQSVPNLRKTTVGPDGTFRLCGLPASFSGSIQATRGAAQTAEVRVELSDVPLLLRGFRMPPPPSATSTAAEPVTDTDSVTMRVSALRTGPATLRGVVTNRGGVPIPDALVTVQGGISSAKVANDGSFTLTSVPVGTQAILVRRVGYLPVEMVLDVTTRGPNTVTMRMETAHTQLSPVKVTSAAPSELTRVGFDKRMKRGMGRFMTEDEIEKAAPVVTSDLLRRINGLHVIGDGASVTVLSSRGESCVRYLIDRNNIDPDQGLSINEVISPREIVAMEFYQSNDIPAEFTTGRNAGCALLVVWTRAQLKEPKR